MSFLLFIFGYVISICYTLTENYGIAILLFTLVTKFLLLPVSVWVHKNSIKMLKIQPQINRLKVKFFGDNEKIAEEQAKLFKHSKYNPFGSIIPLIIQTGLLLIVINVIYRPLTYLLHIPLDALAELSNTVTEFLGIDGSSSTIEMSIVSAVKDNPTYFDALTSDNPDTFQNYIDLIYNFNTDFFAFDLTSIPITDGALIVPLLAGISSLLLCIVQNKANALQADQSKFIQYFTLVFSVGLSLYLGLFVPIGVAVYWIVGNIISILQLFILNNVIKPEKYVDMQELNKSKEELVKLENIGSKKKWGTRDVNSQREKLDYKRFFSISNKKIVFYSENSGFYKYFEGVINQLLKMSNINIHYITSDPEDKIFYIAKEEPRIKAYYIGERKLITLMMKMDAQIVVMTMPDLQNYHIKRSIVKSDIEYIYMFHAPLSFIMTINEGSLDNYDTIFCTGKHHVAEVRECEKLYNLKEKTLVKCGYSLIDNMSRHYDENIHKYKNDVKKILIAPSWQHDNILDSCLDVILSSLIGTGKKIIVRPHPEYIKRYKDKMDEIIEKYKNVPAEELTIETDFSSNETVYSADILITDWSWIAYEYSLATLKPSLFINTETKVANLNWDKLPLFPLNLALRSRIGIELEKEETHTINEKIDYIIQNYAIFEDDIKLIRDEYLYNFGFSAKTEATYILKSLKGDK